MKSSRSLFLEHLNRRHSRDFSSALIDSIEGMMREQLLAGSNLSTPHSGEEIRSTLSLFIDSAFKSSNDVRQRTAALARHGRIAKLADGALIPNDLSLASLLWELEIRKTQSAIVDEFARHKMVHSFILARL